MQTEPGENMTSMEVEFKKLSSIQAEPEKFVTANLPCNKFKNRLVNILPYESSRVCLQPVRGIEGSDYINASFIDGYRYRGAYIATQGPLAETVEDFWRMLWEHNSTIIVMLTKQREMGRVRESSKMRALRAYYILDRNFSLFRKSAHNIGLQTGRRATSASSWTRWPSTTCPSTCFGSSR